MDISVRSEGPWVPEDRSWLGSAHGTTATRSITLDNSAFTANTHYPNGYLPSGMLLSRLSSGLYGPYAGQASEVQTVTISGGPTGGTFTLSYAGQTTAAIAYNASAATVKTALEGLSNVEPGDVTVTGSAGGPYTVTFGGRLSGDQPAMTATSSLTGGTSPSVAVATTTGGGSSATDGSNVAAGHLFNSTKMTAGGADQMAPLLEHGIVRVSKLPTNSGLDQAARNALRGQIIYR